MAGQSRRAAARLAAHAVGPPARPARPLAARHRDRRHRAWAGPRRALERPDRRRPRLLGRAAFAAGRGRSFCAVAPERRARRAAGRAAARRAGICDRRHDLAVQVGGRRRLQGGRAAAAARHPSALRPAGRRLPRRCATTIKRADQIAAYFEATVLAGFSIAEAAQFFGRPRGISADRFDLACKPAKTVQAAFLKRFAAIEKLRD